jgi:hypothetical protein
VSCTTYRGSVCILIVQIQHADKYQQAFSYDNTPCLHAAIPMPEKLHKAWHS